MDREPIWRKRISSCLLVASLMASIGLSTVSAFALDSPKPLIAESMTRDMYDEQAENVVLVSTNGYEVPDAMIDVKTQWAILMVCAVLTSAFLIWALILYWRFDHPDGSEQKRNPIV